MQYFHHGPHWVLTEETGQVLKNHPLWCWPGRDISTSCWKEWHQAQIFIHNLLRDQSLQLWAKESSKHYTPMVLRRIHFNQGKGTDIRSYVQKVRQEQCMEWETQLGRGRNLKGHRAKTQRHSAYLRKKYDANNKDPHYTPTRWTSVALQIIVLCFKSMERDSLSLGAKERPKNEEEKDIEKNFLTNQFPILH